MWEFRPIGKYYELLIDGDRVYLCGKQDTIIQAVIEALCNRHNKAINKLLKEMNKESSFVVDCDEAYNNGYADGKEEGYEEGYSNGYRRGLADAIACEDKLT